MITASKQTIMGRIIWILCVFFFLYEFFLRTVMGTFQPSIMGDLDLTSVEYAILSSSAYLLIYGLMQIPVGVIIDRYGLRNALLVGALACAASCFGVAMAHTYFSALGFRMLMGFGSSFGFICVLFSVYEYLPEKFRASFIGISQFMGTLGPMLAAGPLGSYMTHSGVHWRSLFLVLGGIGCFFALLSIVLIKHIPQSTKYILLKRPATTQRQVFKSLLRKEPWMIALFSAFSYFSIEYLAEAEGVALLASKGIAPNTASYFISLLWIGYAIGCPLAGFLSDHFQRRKSLMASIALVGGLALFLAIFSSHPAVLGVLFFLAGFGSSAQSLGFARISEEFKKSILGLGLGLNNALIITMIALNAPLISWALGLNHQSMTPGQSTTLFIILALMFCTSFALAAFFIKETFCKSQRDPTPLQVG